MKVSELITQLSELDPNLDVCYAIDDEGNGYRFDNSVSIAYCDPSDIAKYWTENIHSVEYDETTGSYRYENWDEDYEYVVPNCVILG